jgi:DNA polymerase I-like protein with 3'-5' exonuclease and polymerase domains
MEEGKRTDPLSSKSWERPPQVVIEFWHSKFDQEFLYPICGIDWWHPESFEDGMLANYVRYTDDEHGLKENAHRKIKPIEEGDVKHHYEMIKFEHLFPKGMKKKAMKFADLFPETEGNGWNTVLYGCSDGICTNLVCARLVPYIMGIPHFANTYRLEKQVAQAVRILERQRILINKDAIAELLEEAEAEFSLYEKKIVDLAAISGFSEFNPGSNAQLADFLFTTQGLNLNPKPGKTANGQYKTDEKTIEALAEAHPDAPEVLIWIIKYRQISKVKGTYLKSLAKNTDEINQIRLNFKQTGAATGRFTAPKGNPDHGFGGIPIHGIPARDDPKKPKVAHSLRRMFVARPGYKLVKADYASQELRIAANISGEKKWIAEYNKELETGEPADLHFLTAQAFFPDLTAQSPDFKLKRNMGKCVHPGTLVRTAGGLKPMSDLGDFGDTEGFMEAPQGLLIDGDPVVSLYNGGQKSLVHVVSKRGVLTCTESHLFALVNGDLVRAGDLSAGDILMDYLAPVNNRPLPHRLYIEGSYSESELTELGALLARLNEQGLCPTITYTEGRVTVEDTDSHDPPNEVLAVVPAGEGPCLDVTMGTEDHLYYANGVLTHNTANFALIYGGGVGAVQRATGCDKHEGARLKAAFDESVPQFSRWVKGQHDLVKKDLGVSTIFRRFISVPDADITPKQVQARALKQAVPRQLDDKTAWKEAQKIRSACERKSTNFPIQGCLKATSVVQTSAGDQAIGDLEAKGTLFDVWVGDCWAPALAVNMGACERAEILLKDGTLIECDTRHKNLIVTPEGYQWVDYADLEPGMAVATVLHEPLDFIAPTPLPPFEVRERSNKKPYLPLSLEKDLWYWLGRYMGDGWLDPRGAITFSFGDHEKVAINQCCAFWTALNLSPILYTETHQPKNKESTRHRIEVWSVDLYDWLLKLGLSEKVTAHTKRLPARIFSETLEHRKAFMQGLMDSDGHKPKLPLKLDGVWEKNKKGNPYNLHLCQRPLLVEVKRLLRTLGVESCVWGPYRSGTDKSGEATTSYRLDIHRRLFDQNILGKVSRLPTFKDMHAPTFLVREFLEQGPYALESFQGNASAYNLYLRLRDGGNVTIYTLKSLCNLLGVRLRSPIYAFKRLVSKESLGFVEDTFTLSVNHPLHRFESDGVITKNTGADILKFSLVMLYKELTLRGWLKNGGDDSVRLLMTVHDEIVFEIKEDRIAEALPILIKIMEYPSTMAKWRVPLVVEAEIGDSWAAKLNWLSILRGSDKHALPDYLKGREIVSNPDLMILANKPEQNHPKEARVLSEGPNVEAVPKEETPTEETPTEETPVEVSEDLDLAAYDLEEEMTVPMATHPTPTKSSAPPPAESAPPPSESRKGAYKTYAVFRMSLFFKDSVASLYQAMEFAYGEALKQGKRDELIPIEIHDGYGEIYYPASEGYLSHPEELARRFSECNIGPRNYEIRSFSDV